MVAVGGRTLRAVPPASTAAVTPAGVRDGDPVALAALTERRGSAVLAYAERVAGPEGMVEAAGEALARFRAAVVAVDDPLSIDPEALLLHTTRAAAAARVAGARPAGETRIAGLDCANVPKLLAARADGDLSPAEERRLVAHLEQCPACRGTESRLAAAERAYREGMDVPPPRDLARSLVAALLSAAPTPAAAPRFEPDPVVVVEPAPASFEPDRVPPAVVEAPVEPEPEPGPGPAARTEAELAPAEPEPEPDVASAPEPVAEVRPEPPDLTAALVEADEPSAVDVTAAPPAGASTEPSKPRRRRSGANDARAAALEPAAVTPEVEPATEAPPAPTAADKPAPRKRAAAARKRAAATAEAAAASDATPDDVPKPKAHRRTRTAPPADTAAAPEEATVTDAHPEPPAQEAGATAEPDAVAGPAAQDEAAAAADPAVAEPEAGTVPDPLAPLEPAPEPAEPEAVPSLEGAAAEPDPEPDGIPALEPAAAEADPEPDGVAPLEPTAAEAEPALDLQPAREPAALAHLALRYGVPAVVLVAALAVALTVAGAFESAPAPRPRPALTPVLTPLPERAVPDDAITTPLPPAPGRTAAPRPAPSVTPATPLPASRTPGR